MTGDQPRLPTHRHTEVLDPTRAAAEADPTAVTRAIPRPPRRPEDGTSEDGPLEACEDGSLAAHELEVEPGQLPRPLVGRRVAAEIGMYVGAALVLLAVGRSVVDGWQTWEPPIRWTFVGLVLVALFALGLFIRLPWRRVLSAQRRRAVSALLTAATMGTAAGAAWLWPTVRDQTQGAPPVVSAVAVAAAMVVVNLIARSPLSESVLLGCLGWLAWVTVPSGPLAWAVLVALGVLWAGLGIRWARGRWVAAALGTALALSTCVPLAEGAWQWPIRAVLAVLASFGLVAFVRGRANYWLALGAGASTALAASVASELIGSDPALLVGGLATMTVAWMALRTAGAD